jgi:thiol-disulfide isomerase/thioredoxin
MKPILSFLATLCLFLNASAQESPINKSTDQTTKGIRIGQPVPDVLVTGATGLTIKNKEVSAFRLSELRGKLVILDFWATWCAPCRKMAPVLDSLQKTFGDQILIIQVAYERAEAIAPVVAAMQKVKPFRLPGVTADTVLNHLFPHHSLPHFVWIDRSGTVRAITEEKEVNAANISKMLQGGEQASPKLAVKQDIVLPYEKQQPLFIGGNGINAGTGTSALVYHSLLSRYVPGLQAGMDIFPPDSNGSIRANIRNVPLTWLFRMAYSDQDRWFSGPRMRLLTADSANMKSRLTGQDYQAWLNQGHGWCYELLVPATFAASPFQVMRDDVRRLFPQYDVAVENTRTRCLVLVRTSADDKLHSAGGTTAVSVEPFSCELRNALLAHFIKRLQVQYLAGFPLPVVDETGYTRPVDLVLQAPMNDVAAMNSELQKYNLRFEEKETRVDLLVVRDHLPKSAQNQNPKP